MLCFAASPRGVCRSNVTDDRPSLITTSHPLQPPQAQQAPLQIQPSIISQQAVAAAAAAAQQQYAAVPVSMVETGRQMLLTVSRRTIFLKGSLQ